jgi:hypothetical protein
LRFTAALKSSSALCSAPLAQIQRAAIVEGERGVGAHLKHEIVVRHRVLVIALSFISKPAAVDIVGVVRSGGMGRLERG